MKKTIVQILKVTAFLALGVLLLYFAFRGVALDKLFETLRRANFWWIGFSLFFAGISFFFRARRWMLLIPRSRESFQTISVNALGLVGALLVRDEQEMSSLKQHGPMAALRYVTFPRRT